MITTQTVLDQLAGKGIVNALLITLAENFKDFAKEKKQYEDAMKLLESELGDSGIPSVKDVAEAIERQTASNLLFSGILGLKANLDNFIDPVARNFLDTDYEIFLREQTASQLPEYRSAQQVRDRFYASLSPEQRGTYEAVASYVNYLETAGPKLAHYYGYLLGNELLYRIVPGYHQDSVQTARYSVMMQEYFGGQFSWCNLPVSAFSFDSD